MPVPTRVHGNCVCACGVCVSVEQRCASGTKGRLEAEVSCHRALACRRRRIHLRETPVGKPHAAPGGGCPGAGEPTRRDAGQRDSSGHAVWGFILRLCPKRQPPPPDSEEGVAGLCACGSGSVFLGAEGVRTAGKRTSMVSAAGAAPTARPGAQRRSDSGRGSAAQREC